MKRDRGGTGVQSEFAQLLAQGHDGIFFLGRGLVGSGLWATLAGSERCLTSGSEELYVAVHPGFRTTGGRRDLPHRPALDQDRRHGIERQIHGDTSSPAVPEMVRHGVPETLGPKTAAGTTLLLG
ncbi:MAG: hypothetical protein WAO09_09160 [Candidatus Dormiibacterota bacterium]